MLSPDLVQTASKHQKFLKVKQANETSKDFNLKRQFITVLAKRRPAGPEGSCRSQHLQGDQP